MILPLVLISSGLLFSTSSSSVPGCPPQWSPSSHVRVHRDSCFLFVVDHEREFDTAEAECESKGGHLAIIRDMDTQNFLSHTLKDQLRTEGYVWIGLSDSKDEGNFVWVDGSPATFTHWASGQPGMVAGLEDCVTMRMEDGGRWHDNRCSDVWFVHHRHTFVCQHSLITTTPLPTTTTTTPKPTTTTLKPTTTTPKPTTTTPKPTTTTPKPTTTTPKPTTTTPNPTTTTPKPTTTTPKPTTTTPKPTTTTPKPTTTTPKPTTTTPKPTTTTPKPTTTTPKPTTATPKPTVPSTVARGTTTTTAGKADCPPFACDKVCGMSPYVTGEDGCQLCECSD